jgi:hypothetical protein
MAYRRWYSFAVSFARALLAVNTSCCDTSASSTSSQSYLDALIGTIGGALISWQSKGQPSVMLPSTEAEYFVMSQCAEEVKFVVTSG